MSKLTFKFILLTVILVLLQAVGLNHICLFGIAVGFIYIYVILHLPIDLSQNWALTIGFLLGLVIDTFSDTQGVCALSCTILAAVRGKVLKLYLPREEELTDPCPSFKSIGAPIFLKYTVTMSLIYCTTIFIVDAFSFFSPVILMLKILSSTLLTWLLLIAVDTIISHRDEKRL
jgi:rod shape-determining protein MreD